jgi:hypothetical protein
VHKPDKLDPGPDRVCPWHVPNPSPCPTSGQCPTAWSAPPARTYDLRPECKSRTARFMARYLDIKALWVCRPLTARNARPAHMTRRTDRPAVITLRTPTAPLQAPRGHPHCRLSPDLGRVQTRLAWDSSSASELASCVQMSREPGDGRQPRNAVPRVGRQALQHRSGPIPFAYLKDTRQRGVPLPDRRAIETRERRCMPCANSFSSSIRGRRGAVSPRTRPTRRAA